MDKRFGIKEITTILGAALVGLTIVFLSCSEEVTDYTPGTALIARNITVHDTTIVASSSSTYKSFVPMDSRITGLRKNMLGHTGNYDAYLLLQFTPAYFGQRETVNVVSAKLTLRAVTWFGDSSSTFGFTVHKINKSWSENTVTWDSISMNAGFYDPAIRGTYSGSIQADTQTISVDLDTSMVREWLLPRTVQQYGVILVPTMGTNIARGINAFNYDSTRFYPTLQVIARGTSTTVPDTVDYYIGQDTFVGNIDNLATDPSLLYLQAGVVYRSTLKFDLSFIPKGAIINSAELQMVRDSATSRLTRFAEDTVAVAHVLFSETDFSMFEAAGAAGQSLETSPYRFTFDVRHAAQVWITGINDGLVLRQSDLTEYSSLFLYTFYNELASDVSKRPKLVLKYTIDKN